MIGLGRKDLFFCASVVLSCVALASITGCYGFNFDNKNSTELESSIADLINHKTQHYSKTENSIISALPTSVVLGVEEDQLILKKFANPEGGNATVETVVLNLASVNDVIGDTTAKLGLDSILPPINQFMKPLNANLSITGGLPDVQAKKIAVEEWKDAALNFSAKDGVGFLDKVSNIIVVNGKKSNVVSKAIKEIGNALNQSKSLLHDIFTSNHSITGKSRKLKEFADNGEAEETGDLASLLGTLGEKDAFKNFVFKKGESLSRRSNEEVIETAENFKNEVVALAEELYFKEGEGELSFKGIHRKFNNSTSELLNFCNCSNYDILTSIEGPILRALWELCCAIFDSIKRS